MKKKSGKWAQFLHKLRFKYRVTVVNENTLEESWHVRLSRFSMFLYTSLFVLITFVLLTVLIMYTPLKFYLPGYGNGGERSHIIEQSMQVDSLLTEMKLQETYLTVLKSIVTGEIRQDSVASLDSVSLKERAEVLIEKSKAEKEFTAQFEEEEKYNLGSLKTKEVDNIFVFFKPTTGVISSAFDLQERQYGISILTSANESVVSVLAGTVIYAAFTFDYGWVIEIQHEDNYISIYKNNNSLLKRAGDKVRAGEAIAFTGDDPDDKSGRHFYFELWKEGKPVNPEEVIIF